MSEHVEGRVRVVWVPDLEWRAATGGRCRRYDRDGYCGAPAVAEFKRGSRRPQWWKYCPAHMYARVLLDGVVYFYRVVEADQPLPPGGFEADDFEDAVDAAEAQARVASDSGRRTALADIERAFNDGTLPHA